MSDKNDIQSYALPKHTIVNNGESHYCVEEVLGAGGFGITYKVSTIIQDRGIKVKTFLAMKELFIKGKGCYRDADHTRMLYAPTVSDSIKQSMGDFLKEAKRLSQLGSMSPNIVQVYEVFEANGTAYYVMEYLDGQDLSHNIKKNVGLNEKQALSYIISIAHAVDILHREHVLHLDIKPANIVFKRDTTSGENIPVLIDFGVSKHFDKNGKATTHPYAKGVSDGFAPIEQYTSVNYFAPEMDIYALGATLYFMLTGNIPPYATEVPSTKTLLSALPAETSNGVKNAITKAMQPLAEKRTHSVADFLACFESSISTKTKDFSYKEDLNPTKTININSPKDNFFSGFHISHKDFKYHFLSSILGIPTGLCLSNIILFYLIESTYDSNTSYYSFFWHGYPYILTIVFIVAFLLSTFIQAIVIKFILKKTKRWYIRGLTIGGYSLITLGLSTSIFCACINFYRVSYPRDGAHYTYYNTRYIYYIPHNKSTDDTRQVKISSSNIQTNKEELYNLLNGIYNGHFDTYEYFTKNLKNSEYRKSLYQSVTDRTTYNIGTLNEFNKKLGY